LISRFAGAYMNVTGNNNSKIEQLWETS
jgi:hypothetical protein